MLKLQRLRREVLVYRIYDGVLTIVASFRRLGSVSWKDLSDFEHKHAFVQDWLVSKHNYLKFSVALEPSQYAAAWPTAGFCV